MTCALPEFVSLRLLRGLGSLPTDRSAVLRHARKVGWKLDWQQGRGGRHLVVNTRSLPDDVLTALCLRRAGVSPEDTPDPELWSSFAGKPSPIQADAERSLSAVLSFEEKRAAGKSVVEATAEVCAEAGVSRATLQRLRAKVRDVPRADWLPVLAKNYKGGGKNAEMSEEAWQYFLSLVEDATADRPLAQIYRDTEEAARNEGWQWPSYVTVLRRWERLGAGVKALLRSGPKAFDKTQPPQDRSVAHLGAMDIVNLDGRVADVFVRDEDGTVYRPTVIAIQDVHSRKFLGWMDARSEDADTTKKVILGVIDEYGLFDELRTDNSRAFASNKIAGGAPHRFRGKKGDDEVSGVLTMIGARIGFATPRNGRAKPIERAFLDVKRNIDTSPEFKGAYCGGNPNAKPEDFEGRAVDIAVFRQVCAREFQALNARPGRRTEMGKGRRSFDEVFAESYAKRPRRALTDAQRRFFKHDMVWLKPNRDTGALSSKGFRWWSAEHQDTLLKHRNGKVCVLFDPTDRSRPVTVLDKEGRTIVESLPCMKKGRFDSTEDARQYQRGKRQQKKAAKAGIKALNLMTAAQMNNIRNRAIEARPETPPPATETNVTKPLFGTPVVAEKTAPEQSAEIREIERETFEDKVNRGFEKYKAALKEGIRQTG